MKNINIEQRKTCSNTDLCVKKERSLDVSETYRQPCIIPKENILKTLICCALQNLVLCNVVQCCTDPLLPHVILSNQKPHTYVYAIYHNHSHRHNLLRCVCINHWQCDVVPLIYVFVCRNHRSRLSIERCLLVFYDLCAIPEHWRENDDEHFINNTLTPHGKTQEIIWLFLVQNSKDRCAFDDVFQYVESV